MLKNPLQEGLHDFGVRLLIVLLALAAAIFIAEKTYALLQSFSNVILIFFLAWLIAFLLSPAADALEQHGVPRGLAVLIVYGGLFLILALASGLLTPLLLEQGRALERQIPEDLVEVLTFLGGLEATLGQWGISLDIDQLLDVRNVLEQVQQWGTVILQNTLRVVTSVTGVVSNLLLILIISVYIMLEGRQVGLGIGRVLPPGWRDEWTLLRQTVNQSFGGFVRGQITLALLYGIGAGLVMVLAGVDFALITALITTLLAVIPFFGPILGLFLPILMTLFQAPWYVTAIVTVTLVVLQFTLFQVVAPRLMGTQVGLSPLLVLAALLIGMQISGLWGALFGVPVAAVLYTMAGFFHRRIQAVWEDRPPEPQHDPPSQVE